MTSPRLLIAILAAALGCGGCAALGLTGAAVGAGAFSTGAGVALDAGKEITRGGVVYRTFSVPLSEVRLALGDTLERMEIAVVRDELDGDGRFILARARDREIEIRLQPVTRTVTRLRLVVSLGAFRKDRATASEIVVQTERAVDERVAASVGHGGVRRAAPGSGASSPVRGARR